MLNGTKEVYIIGRKILYRELAPVWEAMKSMDYAVIKGDALSQQIYGELGKRYSGDVDILIGKDDIRKLEELLRKAGFEQQDQGNHAEARKNRILCLAYSHQIPSYHKSKLGVHLNVDVNYDIFWGEYEGKRYPIKYFLEDTVETEIYGFKVKVLNVEKAFVQLILHHYREMNSLHHLAHGNCIRTKLFQDIYDMLKLRHEILDHKCVEDLCEYYQIGEIVYYMLFFTNQVFQDAFLEKFIARLSKYRNAELLNSYGLYSKERKMWKIPFEERLDNNMLWEIIANEMTEMDLRKIEITHRVFT